MAKIWFGLIALAVLLVPIAASGDSARPFTAPGNLCLVELPAWIVGAPQPSGIQVIALGEKLAGAVTSSFGWDALAGAPITATITQEASLFDFGTMTFLGTIRGRLAVASAEGVLSGRLNGTVSGMFLDPGDIPGSITESAAQVSWRVTGEGGKAWGDGSVTFAAAPDGTFCGPLVLSGSVKGR